MNNTLTIEELELLRILYIAEKQGIYLTEEELESIYLNSVNYEN